MANFNSDIATSPARAPRYGSVIGRKAKIQIPTGFVATDTLSFFKLPKAAVVLVGGIYADNPGTALIGDVGYLGGTIDSVAEDPNAYAAALDISAGGAFDLFAAAGFIDVAGLDAERMVALTASTVTVPTVGADIVCFMQYMLSA